MKTIFENLVIFSLAAIIKINKIIHHPMKDAYICFQLIINFYLSRQANWFCFNTHMSFMKWN